MPWVTAFRPWSSVAMIRVQVDQNVAAALKGPLSEEESNAFENIVAPYAKKLLLLQIGLRLTINHKEG